MPAPVAVCVVAAIAGVAAVIAFHEVIFFLISYSPTNLLFSLSMNPTSPPQSSVGQRTFSLIVVLAAEVLFL